MQIVGLLFGTVAFGCLIWVASEIKRSREEKKRIEDKFRKKWYYIKDGKCFQIKGEFLYPVKELTLTWNEYFENKETLDKTDVYIKLKEESDEKNI